MLASKTGIASNRVDIVYGYERVYIHGASDWQSKSLTRGVSWTERVLLSNADGLMHNSASFRPESRLADRLPIPLDFLYDIMSWDYKFKVGFEAPSLLPCLT